jgi:O-antigen/teichoic acid export membrane protein
LQISGVGLLFLMHAVFARSIGPSGYGIFAYALAMTAVLSSLVPLGWPTALLRFISEYVEGERWGLLKGALRRSYQTTFLVSIVAALILYGASYLVQGDTAIGMRYAALLLPLSSFVGLRRKALRALGKLKTSIVLEDIGLPSLAIVGVLLVGIATASGAVAVYLCSAVVIFILSNWQLRRSLPAEGRYAKAEFQTQAWMVVALPMAFGGAGQLLLTRADVLVLGALTSPETVGLYNAAGRISVLVAFSLNAVNAVVAPMISAAFHGGRRGQAKRLLYRAMLLSTLGALPVFAFVALFPGFLLGFFGQEFVEASPLLRILAIGQLINAITGPVGFALLMTGREKAFAGTMGVVIAGTLAGHLLLIPHYGATGAAIVTAASIAILNCWQFLISTRSIA